MLNVTQNAANTSSIATVTCHRSQSSEHYTCLSQSVRLIIVIIVVIVGLNPSPSPPPLRRHLRPWRCSLPSAATLSSCRRDCSCL